MPLLQLLRSLLALDDPDGGVLTCRAMIESVQDCSTITLHDDTPQQVGLLISLIYDRRMENLTREAVDSALKICRKCVA